MIVRRLAHGFGYRFRLYRPGLAGQAGFDFPSPQDCLICSRLFLAWARLQARGAHSKTNVAYWSAKIAERDTRRRLRILDNHLVPEMRVRGLIIARNGLPMQPE
jgi:G:T-mismatch repair DNA endonuclease (very short patch repair protein)